MTRRPGVVRKAVAAVLVSSLTVAVAWGGVSYFYNRTFPRVDTVYEQLRAAGIYLDRYGAGRPAVFILDRRGPAALFSAKFRTYVVKAEMPSDQVDRVLIFPGKLQDLQVGRPTILPEGEPWMRAFNGASRAAWSRVGPALRAGAVVLMVQRFAVDPFKAAMAQDPSRQVFPGVYVVRGPVHPLGSVPPPPTVGLVVGAVVAVALFVLLGLAGWGFVRFAVASAGVRWFDVALLAPAAGAGASVLAGFLIAAVGGDPRGPPGIVGLAAVVAVSGFLGLRHPSREPAPPPSIPGLPR